VKRDNRQFLTTAIHVTGLWAIAVAQPLLDVLGRAPEFFVAHRAGAVEILLLLAVLLLAAPLGLIAVIVLAGALGSVTRRIATGTILTVLLAAVAVQLLKRAGVESWPIAVGSAAVAGLIVAVLYFRFAALSSFFTVLAAGSLLVPVVFLLRPEVRRLILPNTVESASADPSAAGFVPAPIVLLVFDEMPLVSLLDADGQIDPAVYPNISALAREGVWFRNATTISDYTRWALPAILTGRRPRARDLPTSGDHPDSLFTVLRRTHRLEVFEPVTNLCPRTLCPDPDDTFSARIAGIGNDLSILAAYVFLTPDLHQRLQLPDLTAKWGGFSAADVATAKAKPRDWQRHVQEEFRDDRREILARFVENISAADPQPTFYFLHMLLPHQPWVLLPTGHRNASLAPLPSAMRVVARNDDWEIAQNVQRHLLQVGFLDRAVGRVVARLNQTGLYERALVVVTADHGVAITKGHHVRAFSTATAAEIIRIPVIVKFPVTVDTTALFPEVNRSGQRVSDRNVETIDIAPTVAHVLGVPLPWKTDGASLLDLSRPPRIEKRVAFASATKTQRYGPEGPPIAPLLQQRDGIFGSGNRYHIPRPPRYGELVGRGVTEYRVVDSNERADVGFAWQFANFNPDAGAVPFDVGGQLHDRTRNAKPTFVAVSVNGVIHAVTRTWTSRPGGWVATPPLDVWQRGKNVVDVFIIEESEGQPVLHRLRRPTSRPADLNLITGAAEHYWNVRQRGFHRHEGKGGVVFRWARPEASVTVPLQGERPVAVRLKVARAVEPTATLRVTANDCTIYEGTVPHHEWDATLSLAPCNLETHALTIKLTTEATRTRIGRDSRRLGVALRHIILQTERANTGD
jgi:hypothetical protein